MHNAAHSVMPVKCFTDNRDSWHRMSKITAVIHFTVLSPWTIKDLTDTLRSEASISSWQLFLYKIKHCFYHEGPHDMYVTWTFFVFTIVNGIEGCFLKKTLDNELILSTKPFYISGDAEIVTVFNNIVSFLSSQFNLREKGKSSGGIACIWTIAALDVFKAVHQ